MPRGSGIAGRIADLLFPPKCPFCHSVLRGRDELMCRECTENLPYTSSKAGELPFISGAAAPLYYEGKVRAALIRYKFSGKTAYARCFAELIAEEIRSELNGGFDVITWVPLSRARFRKRGYSQTRLLARGTARILDKKAERLLIKPKDIPAQSSIKGEAQRRANTLGAYSVAPRADVRGKRILLIDDVLTTGATVSECAKTLLLNGADEVMCAALCRKRKWS